MDTNTLNFQELNIAEPVLKAISQMNFQNPTPIQTQAIPVALSGSDIIGCAQTGTGKTAAFSIPLVNSLLQNGQSTALILTPTREIAQQVQGVIRKLTQFTPDIRSALIIGGVPIRSQFRDLSKNPRIIVATPGRLIDILSQKPQLLSKMKFIVLDEADQMFDMGFAPQVKQILKVVPQERQILLFSATLNNDVKSLAKQYLSEPRMIIVGPVSKPVEKVNQTTIETTVKQKDDTLLNQLNSREGSVLIFVKTRRRSDRLANYLYDYGYAVDRIHGFRSQKQRSVAISGFKSGKFRILVATDIAARGLDIPHIAHVINYDLPQTAEDYVHRIGRTARAGASGEALSLLTPEDKRLWLTISQKGSPEKSGGFRGQRQKKFSGKNKFQKKNFKQNRNSKFSAKGKKFKSESSQARF